MATPEHKLTGKTEPSGEAGGGPQKPVPTAKEELSVESSAASSGYKIHIPMYEGPLDLLLDLIRQQKMSIHDIQISLITAQYLDYLHKLEELDVDVSAEFIYMAATLIYIKSKMLLPPDPLASPEEQASDPRGELVQRLVEHEKFKNAAQLLYQKQQIEENVWSKPDTSLYRDPGTEGELVVSLVDLVKVFQQVLERRKETVRIELQHEQFTVAQMIAQLRAQIIASVAAGPGAEELDGTQIARLISGARHVEVVPSMQCSRNEDQARANIELMLATARAKIAAAGGTVTEL